jgi:ABC-type branched-subunit amino acid transport system ATPase component
MTGSPVVATGAEPRAEARRAEVARAVGTAAAPLLTVSGLSVSYGPLRALEGVNLSVRAGELVALAGENGAGKTTLVRCIAGDVVPASGEVFFAGRRVPADQVVALKQGIAVVWQDLALCDNLDVAANIMLGRERPRLLMSDTRFHNAAASLLASLRIPLTDTTRNVRSLSGGQRQLVAMAQAMGRKPRLLALDEPTAALGVKEAAQVEEPGLAVVGGDHSGVARLLCGRRHPGIARGPAEDAVVHSHSRRAAGGGRGGHRWHQPVRRPGQDHPRRTGRPRHRWYLQRPLSARRVEPVD